MKIQIWKTVSLVAIVAHFFLGSPVEAENGLMGFYYNGYSVNEGLISFEENDLVMTRLDPNIDFYDGSSSFYWDAVAGGGSYGVRWVGLLHITEAGEYGFGTISDDGSTVRIDGQIVVSNAELQYYDWEDSIAEGSFTGLYPEGYGDPDNLPGPLYLEAGAHTIEVCFYEDAVYDGVELWWLRPGQGASDIPYYGTSWGDGGLTINPNTNWEIVPSEVLSPPISDAPDALKDVVVRLLPAVPNPFNPATSIRFSLNNDVSHASLRIYDVAGRLVRTLHQGGLPAGDQQIMWRGNDDSGCAVPSGVYYGRLEVDGHIETQSMVLAR